MNPLAKHTNCLEYILSKIEWTEGPRHKIDLYYDAPISGQILVGSVWHGYMVASFRKNGDRLYFLYRDDKIVSTFTLVMWM